MKGLVITVSAIAGDVVETLSDMIDISIKLDCFVECEVNGVYCVVSPKVSLEDAHKKFCSGYEKIHGT